VTLSGVSHVRASPARDVPDYDGRGNEDAHPTSWARWIPRVILSPFYFVNEYVLRRPIGWLITKAEREHWIDAAIDTFTFGPQHDYVLYPTALFDLGMVPSVGLFFSGDNTLFTGNSVIAHVATGGPKVVTATVVDRFTSPDGGTRVTARIDFRRQVDLLFLGTGPDVTSATRSRYGLQQLDGHISYKRRLWGEAGVGLAAGARTIGYLQGNCCGDPSLDARIADGSLMAPPGYGAAYTAGYQRADVVLDSRAARPAPGTGGYLRLAEETDSNIGRDRVWIKYGGVVGVAYDLDDQQRTLKLEVAIDNVDPVKGAVPFNELASLGSELMPGFVTGWMTGRSTFATQLAYSWPVAVWLDGETRFSAGNAFGDHLTGFELQKMRLSGDLGVMTIDARDEGLEVLFGLGTETIEQGAHVTSVRLTVGTRGGF